MCRIRNYSFYLQDSNCTRNLGVTGTRVVLLFNMSWSPSLLVPLKILPYTQVTGTHKALPWGLQLPPHVASSAGQAGCIPLHPEKGQRAISIIDGGQEVLLTLAAWLTCVGP